ncbi:MAG: hypothetical protein COW70_05185 [Hydrogenophilales bacterium CG18_big_fil_WC_8_21_14_2_50_58_12]|nr:MAG: hypothetical protein COW70_05185 [Hydrogenophilales bacterium CG18_big_fil_WC_8_21_14_2_50_58_12]
MGKMNAPASGILRALFFDDQGMSQGGQVCQQKILHGFNAFAGAWLPMSGFWLRWLLWLPSGGFYGFCQESTLRGG